MTPEFSRPVDIRHLGDHPHRLSADDAERQALAARFDLVAIERFDAEATLSREGTTIIAEGRLSADIVQSCAVSGEPLAVTIDEPLALRFVPQRDSASPDEEIELDAEDCDEIEYAGQVIDLGEAVAQSLALAIDPYAEGADADRVRREAGLLDEAAAGPFAMLAALKRSD